MIDVDLSTLNQAELRRLSKAARARGDGLLADRVDWEITTRADHSHDSPAFAPLPIDSGVGLDSSVADEMDAGPPAFRPDRHETPDGARGGWRSVGLVVLGAMVGSAATVGGFWAEDAFGRREPAPRLYVARTAPPPSDVVAPGEVAAPAPVLVAQTEPVHPPKAARTVRRPAKARPEPVEDPQSMARQYETRVRELDAARARAEEPIY